MADPKHPAEVLAVRANGLADEAELIHLCSWVEIRNVLRGCAAMLRRIPALEAERDQLRAEVEALRADAERLDFIEKHTDMQLRFRKKRWSMRGFTNYEFDVFLTAREAIDAARKQQ